jgi:8-amino-7-oxononanoate synthase
MEPDLCSSLLIMQPDESNPISKSNDPRPDILADKSSKATFWSHLSSAIAQRQASGLHRRLVVSEPINATTIVRDGNRVINFGSNDYLGLAWHPHIVATRRAAQHEDGKFGSGASPLVTGYTRTHAELAAAISVFEGTKDAIVYSSGYAANLGSVSAMVTKEDVIFSDSLNHASLIDGCRLSRAQLVIYPHCDMDELRRLIQQHRHRGRFAFVVTDSVFSMDGDLAPLEKIDELCREFDLMCVLDEAHATGVYGQTGRGLTEYKSISSERFIRVGTLSKALGCIGGFVSGDQLLIDWLANHSRPWIYSTAMPAPNCLAAIHALRLVTTMHRERELLLQNSIELRSRLRGHGFRVGEGNSPIIPIYFHDADEVIQISQRLLQAGLFVPAIRPPTVPIGSSLLRVSISAAHSKRDFEQLTAAVGQL